MKKNSILSNIIKKPEISVLLSILKISSIDTYNHSIRVAKITEQLLQQLNKYNNKDKENIIIGALLHDIGKVFLPFNITSAPYILSDEEMGIVKVHPYIGYEIVKDTFPKIVSDIILMHHEKADGSGYPNGNRLRNIPNYVLIVQVADIFDAIRSARPYKKGETVDKAISIMEKECRMIKLDDEYVNNLKNIIMEKDGNIYGTL